jgi:hypothetical protein
MSVVNKTTSRYGVYIGRGSKWGNPYTHISTKKTKAVVVVATREESIRCYVKWVLGIITIPGLNPPTLEEIRRELTGKTLGCYCKPLSCHGDFLHWATTASEEEIQQLRNKLTRG